MLSAEDRSLLLRAREVPIFPRKGEKGSRSTRTEKTPHRTWAVKRKEKDKSWYGREEREGKKERTLSRHLDIDSSSLKCVKFSFAPPWGRERGRGKNSLLTDSSV